ncbi:MAG: MBL fold metallo-hydrolase [Burkholderiales bacterium]
MHTRDLALIAALLALLAGPVHAQSKAAPTGPDFKVTLLGTGSPAPLMNRFGPGTLVQVNGQNLLFDAGRGVTQRLLQSKLKLGQVGAVFLTHLHSDHVVGIPDLWLTGWLRAAYAGRDGPFVIYGPAGTANLMEGLQKAYDWDIQTRIKDQNLPVKAVSVNATEIVEGVVYEKDGVKVTAFAVNHGELIKPAFGYRIDYDGRSVLISGDTKLDENLIKHATGVDLLIHQVAAARPELLKIPVFKVIMAHHTSPEEAGTVFARAHPKLAVYYHFVLLGTPKIKPLKEEDVLEMTRTTYKGPLLIGEDLTAFVITKDDVKVIESPKK